ncbi:MAG: galactose-1-phosphate uridylyltransferase [Solirubrobacterales bacterium]
MPEVRIDPINGLRMLVADGRAERPNGLLRVQPPPPIDLAEDPFAEGSEQQTPPEVWADRPGGGAPDTPGWRVRAVPNKYPALDQSFAGDGELADPLGATRGMPNLHVKGPAHGAHEVIVNSPKPLQALAEFSRDELETALGAWAVRSAAHADRAAYVHVSLNEGAVAGSTLPHTHAQIFALDFVPPLIARERERMRAYFEHTQGRNLVEDLLVEEVRAGERLVAIDDHAALIAPFASPTPYRLTVLPRRPEPLFHESEERGAGMLFTALRALASHFGASPPLNLWVRTAPEGAESFSWRIEIAPRIVQPAAFELGTGAGINPVSPETAAAALKAALA